MDIPEDRRYTSEHEWVLTDDSGSKIGISDYAQDQLGDIVFVDLPEVGASFGKGETMAEIESTKSVGEVYAPADLTITSINEELTGRPELINQDPYGEGWIVTVDLGGADLGDLLDAAGYRGLVE